MAKLYYECHYDGKTCDKVIPKVDENGVVIPPKEIDKKAKGISEHVKCWESCVSCPRNHAMSMCHGRLKIEY